MRVWIDGCLCGLWEVVPSKWRFFFFSWAGFFFFFVSNAAPPFLNLRQPIQENGIKEDSRILVVKKTSFPCLIVAWACDDAKGKKKEKKKKKKRKEEKWNILHWQPAAFIASRLRSPQEEGKREREQVLICLLDKNGAKTKGKKRYKPNWMAHRSIKHGGQYINQHANLWDAGHKGANHIARSKALQ